MSSAADLFINILQEHDMKNYKNILNFADIQLMKSLFKIDETQISLEY